MREDFGGCFCQNIRPARSGPPLLCGTGCSHHIQTRKTGLAN